MSTPPLSFDRAHFEGDPPSPDACAYCHRTLEGDYYRVSDNLACSTCAAHAQTLTPPNAHGAFVRASLFGLGAAVLIAIIYALVKLNLPFNISYFAIAVGWVIGKAMHLGAKGNGGRRYQVIAAILTYVAITMSDVPLIMRGYNHDHPATTQSSSVQPSASAPTDGSAAQPANPQPAKTPVSFADFLIGGGALIALGLASPFLILSSSFFQGAIHLFIIYIGVQFAWKFTAPPKVSVEGPFAPATNALPS